MAMTEKQKIGVGVGVVAVILLATMGAASADDPDFVGPDKPDDDPDDGTADPDDFGGDYGGYEDEDEPPDEVDLGKINFGDVGELDPNDADPNAPKKTVFEKSGSLNPMDDFQDLLDILITPEPRVGRFYQIRQGDTWASIAARALKAVHPAFNFGSNRVRLMECMSASQWNRALYGKEGNFNAPNFPAWTSLDDVSIRAAFFNNNQNAVSALRAGQVPSAEGFGSAYGLLWLPIIRANDQAEITCLDVLQDDGSGNLGIEPPTIFKDLLVQLGA